MPGLASRPPIDIAVSAWPFPLQAEVLAKLDSLGYKPLPDRRDPLEQRFAHVTNAFQLFMIEAGSELWTEYRLLREYWLHNEDARRRYSMVKLEWAANLGETSTAYQAAKAEFLLDTLDKARQWWIEHQGFAAIEFVANELQAYRPNWYISGGWALDLFLRRATRVHRDVDIVVPRLDQLELQDHLVARGWKWMTPWQGRYEPWPFHMYLELPRHQIHAFRDGLFLDFQLSDIEQGIWRYRREPAIRRSIERIGLRSKSGIPFLAPELVLLFKSQNTSGRERPRDQTDFERVHPHLEPERRAWLLWAILATDPAHSWIQALAEGSWWDPH